MPKINFRRKKSTILIAILAGGLFIVIFGLLGPLLKKDLALNKEISGGRLKLKKSLTLLSQKEAIENLYSSYSTYFDLNEPRKDKSVSILSDIENVAKAANISILEIRPLSSRAPKENQAVELTAEGDTENFLKFIYDLTYSPYSLSVKKFRLSVKGGPQKLEGMFTIIKLSLD